MSYLPGDGEALFLATLIAGIRRQTSRIERARKALQETRALVARAQATEGLARSGQRSTGRVEKRLSEELEKADLQLEETVLSLREAVTKKRLGYLAGRPER
jgi:hypothetical protein